MNKAILLVFTLFIAISCGKSISEEHSILASNISTVDQLYVLNLTKEQAAELGVSEKTFMAAVENVAQTNATISQALAMGYEVFSDTTARYKYLKTCSCPELHPATTIKIPIDKPSYDIPSKGTNNIILRYYPRISTPDDLTWAITVYDEAFMGAAKPIVMAGVGYGHQYYEGQMVRLDGMLDESWELRVDFGNHIVSDSMEVSAYYGRQIR